MNFSFFTNIYKILNFTVTNPQTDCYFTGEKFLKIRDNYSKVSFWHAKGPPS